jgi:VanZ family protein
MVQKKYIFTALAVYWVVLLFLTSLPGPDIPQSITFNDKLEHLSAFGILGFLLALALQAQERFSYPKRNLIPATLFIGSLYGALDELHQIFIPGRSCELNDWIADTCGIALGIGLSYILRSWVLGRAESR